MANKVYEWFCSHCVRLQQTPAPPPPRQRKLCAECREYLVGRGYKV